MQIRNNAGDGPKPRHSQNAPAEKDATSTRGTPVEPTRGTGEAKPTDGPRDAKSARPSRDSFERSKPQEDPGVDVGERLRQARQQARQKRIENARQQDTQGRRENRVENARADHTRRKREERIANARRDHTERAHARRVANARAQHTERTSSPDELRGDGAGSPGVIESGTDLIQDARGNRESREARAERIQIMRMEYENGILNTADRARAAAERLLGDQ